MNYFKINDKRRWYRDEYLSSEHWKLLRKRKLNQCSKCEICGSNKMLDVHHKNYKNIFDVELGDLQTLCRLCHRKKHSPKSGFKRNKFPAKRIILKSTNKRFIEKGVPFYSANIKINAILKNISTIQSKDLTK